jgi:hypothetical protein
MLMSKLTGNAATLDNQGFALLARLHVILRRQKGRITDIEYMRADPAYFRHVLGLIDATDPDEVRALCSRLYDVYCGPGGLFGMLVPPRPAVVASPQAPLAVPELIAAQSARAVAVSQKYVGRLR